MTKDRLKELQRTTSWPRVSYRRLSRQSRNHDIQSAIIDGGIPFTAIDMDDDHSVAEFLAQIDLVRILIDKIEELAKDVEQIHRKMVEPMADSKLTEQVDDKTADIKKLAYDVSTKLKKMEQAQGDQTENEKSSTQWRIKESQIYNITRRFRDAMNKYNSEFVAHRDRCKRSIMRELEITGNSVTNEEVEEMIEKGFPGTFSLPMMVDIEKAKQAANEIEARHRDITKLETSINELHEMFADLARLVSAQGEMIDNIEHSVIIAKEYVESGTQHTDKAVNRDECNRKKKLWICIIIVAIVVVLILITGSYITIKQKFLGR